MDSLYIAVSSILLASDVDMPPKPHILAKVYLNGSEVASGYAPDYGIYKSEGNSESSAIALAQSRFCRECLSDIRRLGDGNSREWRAEDSLPGA
jgi:hypothetical protein